MAAETISNLVFTGPLALIRPTLVHGLDDPHNGYGPNRFRRLAATGREIVLFGEGEERRQGRATKLSVKMVLRNGRAEAPPNGR